MGCSHFQWWNANIFLKYKNIRKQFYQTVLGNCYGLKLPKCWLQFKTKILCHYYNFRHTFVPWSRFFSPLQLFFSFRWNGVAVPERTLQWQLIFVCLGLIRTLFSVALYLRARVRLSSSFFWFSHSYTFRSFLPSYPSRLMPFPASHPLHSFSFFVLSPPISTISTSVWSLFPFHFPIHAFS